MMSNAGAPFVMTPSLAWVVASVLTLIAGGYLLFGGKMLRDAIYHESAEDK